MCGGYFFESETRSGNGEWTMENGQWTMKVQILRICPIEHNCTLHTTPVPKGSRPGSLPEGAVSRRLTEGVEGAVWPKARLRESLHLYIKTRRTPQGRRSAARQLPHIASLSAGRHKDRPSNARQPPFLLPVPSSPCSLLPVPCCLFPVACSLVSPPPHSSRIIKNSDVINSYPRAILSWNLT